MSSQSITVDKDQRQGGTLIVSTVPTIGLGLSLWGYAGAPSYGAAPAAWANPTNATPGGLRQNIPAGGTQQWLTSMTACFCCAGELVLYDRLMHMGGLSGAVATVQNLNGGAPAPVSRSYTNAVNPDDGNEILLEMSLGIGTTATTVVVNYISSTGASHSTPAVTIGGVTRNLVGRVIRVPLAPGDTGVTSITSIQLAATTGTAGNIAVIIAHRITEIVCDGLHSPKTWTGINDEFLEIVSGACLFFVHWASSAAATGTVAMHAFLNLADF